MGDTDHIEAHLSSLDQRVQGLERWKADLATEVAVREERDKHMDKRFDRLEKGVEEIKGYLLKVVWVIILGIIGAFVTFIIRGGLYVG